jgi:hypothetical protein
MPQAPGTIRGDLTVLGQILEGTAPVHGDVGQIMGVIVHGATAGTARTPGWVGPVTWIGSVSPTNKLTNDVWIDTSGAGGSSYITSVTDTTSIDLTVASGALSAAIIYDATTPAALTPDIAAAVGSANVPARRDHVHNVPAAAPTTTLTASTTTAEGSGSSFARNDHTHAITGFLPSTGGTLSGALLAAVGAVGTPSISFTGDTDTGLYWISANRLGVSAGGTQIMAVVNDAAAGHAVRIVAPAADQVPLRVVPASTPTVRLAEFYNGVGTVASGVDNNGVFQIPDGLVGVPGLQFLSDADTGIFRPSADQMSFVAGGTARAHVKTTEFETTVPIKVPVYTSGPGRPGSPFVGQTIFETDTKRELIWDGTYWRLRGMSTVRTAEAPTLTAVTTNGGVLGTTTSWTPDYLGTASIVVDAHIDFDTNGAVGSVNVQRSVGGGAYSSIAIWSWHDMSESEGHGIGGHTFDSGWTPGSSIQYRVVLAITSGSNITLRSDSNFIVQWEGRV